MMKKLKKKLNSRAGESIGETLLSLLIAALALVMLAGAISASSNVITSSRDKLEKYYTENEKDTGVVKMTSSGTAADEGIAITDTITDSEGAISEQKYDVTYYKNGEFNTKTVIAYAVSDGDGD